MQGTFRSRPQRDVLMLSNCPKAPCSLAGTPAAYPFSVLYQGQDIVKMATKMLEGRVSPGNAIGQCACSNNQPLMQRRDLIDFHRLQILAQNEQSPALRTHCSLARPATPERRTFISFSTSLVTYVLVSSEARQSSKPQRLPCLLQHFV